jgi:hypothetical protein
MPVRLLYLLGSAVLPGYYKTGLTIVTGMVKKAYLMNENPSLC